MSEPLALERNLALMAGAGAGKTHSLMTLCLHLLSGAREGFEPLRPSKLCLVTFTDKAASEMKTRLWSRVDALANGARIDEREPELCATLQRLGRSAPTLAQWRTIRDELGSAAIGTFHGLCVQLLRRAPAGLGTEGTFELLDEGEATDLLEDVAERVVLEALEAGDPHVADLCRELAFRGPGQASGLVELLCETFTKLREEGVEPASVLLSSPEEARAELEAKIGELKSAISTALSSDDDRKFSEVLTTCARAAEGLTFDNFLEPGRFETIARALRAEKNLNRQRREPLASALKVLAALGRPGKDIGLRDLYAAIKIAPHEEAYRRLLATLKEAHREALAQRSALDFTELLIRTRDLLRDHPEARAQTQARIGALLVDEFQDTNRLQLELVVMLAEQREGGPRAVVNVLDLPLEPAFLCIVGDRKQSIYEFRGADVSVFGTLAEKMIREGGIQSYLQRNWRSMPELISFFNGTFDRLMAPVADARPYEVAYQASGDDLLPVRPPVERGGVPRIDRLLYEAGEDAAASRVKDAEAVARRLRQILSGEAGIQVQGKDGVWRTPLGGDIAVLLRRFGPLETYRQALTRYRVPHRVVRGRGFYGAQEILDMASLLALIADPSDAISLCAVLRSPFVGLQDASLFRLSDFGAKRLDWSRLSAADDLPGDESERIAAMVRWVDALRGEGGRLGIRETLNVVLLETRYRVMLAGTPFGEQALANVDKLLDIATRWDKANKGDCAAFAKMLLELAEYEPQEAQADVLDSEDGRAVMLLTIHASKGLEFPIVVIPDLAAVPPMTHSRIPWERSLGLAIKPWLPDDPEILRSPRSTAIASEIQRRERAEYLRLLYVAMTRARDHLILSGPQGTKRTTWWTHVERALAESATLRGLVKDIPETDLAQVSAVPISSDVGASSVSDATLARIEKRVETHPVLRPQGAIVPVTHLQDFILCPRRFFYARQVGLSEYPLTMAWESGEDDSVDAARADPRKRGTLVHAVLERLDFRWALQSEPEQRAALGPILWTLGVAPDEPLAQTLLGWVLGFLRTKFARHLAELDPSRIHREMSFLLPLGEGYLKGQIDLLVEGEDGRVLVVDYKAARRHPRGVDPYRFQLNCYGWAARERNAGTGMVQTGIVFLEENLPEPEWLEIPKPGDISAFRDKLAVDQAGLFLASQAQNWEGRAQGHCAQMCCGYQYRCHA